MHFAGKKATGSLTCTFLKWCQISAPNGLFLVFFLGTKSLSRFRPLMACSLHGGKLSPDDQWVQGVKNAEVFAKTCMFNKLACWYHSPVVGKSHPSFDWWLSRWITCSIMKHSRLDAMFSSTQYNSKVLQEFGSSISPNSRVVTPANSEPVRRPRSLGVIKNHSGSWSLDWDVYGRSPCTFQIDGVADVAFFVAQFVVFVRANTQS